MRRERRHARLLPAQRLTKPSTSVLSFALLLAALAAVPANAAVSLVDSADFSVAITADESVSVACTGDKVQVTTNGTPGVFATDCAAVTSLTVGATGTFNNDIDLSGVTAALFPSLASVSINGGGGVDNLKGSQLGDTVRGGTGADTFEGLGGNDTFTWDPGDGSDLVIGGDGSDTLVFNGSAGDEIFTLNPDGTRFEFLRNLGNIDMAVESTEILQLFGLGGADQLTVNNLTGVADLVSAQISMGDGADIVNASAQANAAVALTINGDAGNDNLTGSPNADTIDGGADNDFAAGGKGADTFLGQDGDDSFTWFPGDGSDLVIGGNGNDTLIFRGSDGDEVFALNPDGARFEFLRNVGNIDMAVESTETLRLFALGGVDQLTIGNLTGVADLVTAELSMGDGADTVNASAQANAAVALTIRGDAGDDDLTGSPNADTIDGSAGNDSLSGLDGNDLLEGGADVDTMTGGRGADTLDGQDGGDTFVWNNGDGSDVVIGGEGDDTLIFNGSAGDETFTLNPDGTRFELLRNLGTIDMAVESTETLQLFALGGADSLTVNNLTGVADLASAQFSMGDGADTVNASAQANAAVALTINGEAGNDNLTGSPNADTIDGGADNDFAAGGKGADTFLGQDGDDSFTWLPGDGSDLVIGGNGNDTLVFRGSDSDEVFALNPDGTRFEFLRNLGNIDMAVESTETLELFGLGGADQLTVGDLTGVADLVTAELSMGDGNDTVNASAQANAAVALTIRGDGDDDNLTGSPNADVIDGSAGNDSLSGLGGADTLDGGDGNDQILGGTGADTMNGSDADDTLTWNPGDGSDLIIGGEGSDTLVFNGSAGDEIFTLNPDGARFEFLRNLGNIDMAVESTEIFQLFGLGGADQLTVNNLTGVADLVSAQLSMGDGADIVNASAQANPAVALTINGDAGNDNLTGSPNADTIDGGADNDVAFGGKGADTFLGQDGDDSFTWDPGDGSDLVIGGNGSDTLVFNGSAGDEVFTLNPDGARFEFLRNLGNIDMAVESTEIFQLFGLGGADQLTVNNLTGVADLVSAELFMGDGADIVNASAQANAAVNLTIEGGAGDDNLTGSPNADTIEGGADNDFAVGGKGADTFLGQDGDDSFTWLPGDGSDLVIGGNGSDTLIFRGSDGDETFALNPDGARFEFLRNLGNIDMAVESTETLRLFALGGADQLTVGNLTGVADLVTAELSMGDGEDTVNASAQANPAVALTIRGDEGDDDLTGSPNADVIDGSAGNDSLSGLDGNDLLEGGADVDTMDGGHGADTLDGQDGGDTFVWNNGDGSDVVNGGEGDDTLIFNGSAASELFNISASVGGFGLTRDVGNIVMSAETTESLVLGALDGDDVVQTVGLADTAQDLAGGGQVVYDELKVDAKGAHVTSTADSINIEGAQPITFSGFELLNVANGSQTVNAMPHASGLGLLAAGLLLAATVRLRRRRSS